jgi:cytochrome P450
MAIQAADDKAISGGASGAVGLLRTDGLSRVVPRTRPTAARRAPARSGRPLPGPRGYPVIGVMPDLFRHVTALPLLRDAWRAYGDAVQLPLGPYKVCFFARPDAVKRILVDNRENYPRAKYQMRWLSTFVGTGLVAAEGEHWRTRRHLMHKLFTARSVAGYTATMASAVEDVVARWDRRVAAGRPEIELSGEMVQLSLDALGRSVLGFDAVSTIETLNQAIRTVSSYMASQAPTPFPPPRWIPTPANLRFNRALREFDAMIDATIRARRAAADRDDAASDLLSLMLRAQDDQGNALSERDVRDEAMTIYFAGHDSTSVALGWAFHAISQHPEVEQRLHEEVDRVVGDGPLTAAAVERLPYTEMVVRETLRLYPSFAMIPKDVVADDEIDGFHVPGGSIMVVSPHLTHRHPELWPDPERFDPERHAPGQIERQHRYSWIPFGGGAHACIGSAFALLEMKLAIAAIVRRYRMTPLRPARPADMLIPRPVGGLHMRLDPRR